MHTPTQYATKTASAITVLAICSALSFIPFHAAAQMQMPSSQAAQSQPQQGAPTQSQDTQEQLTQLKQQLVKLQAALQQSKSKKSGSSKGTMNAAKPAMGMEEESGEMGGMSPDAEKPPMGPMKGKMGDMGEMAPSSGAMKGKSAEPIAKPGCCGMSMGKPMPEADGMADAKKTGMQGDSMPSMKGNSMAGSKTEEAPHLLHVGAKDFYLDHAQHIGLTPVQKRSLQRIKSETMQQKATSQKQIDAAEQELWQLTSADQPNSAQIDSKVNEIAKFNATQQVAIIHAVSMASNVLTPDQRAEVVKSAPSANGTRPQMQKQPMTDPMKMHR